jgi:hypothetical protein
MGNTGRASQDKSTLSHGEGRSEWNVKDRHHEHHAGNCFPLRCFPKTNPKRWMEKCAVTVAKMVRISDDIAATW